ncbi:MAG: hypothetical protein H7240_05630, partial [Glaciimonas sp.]|nr:hypothetical protein [Glaciimonas sp.]
FSIKKKELSIAFANLTVVLISVTRTQLVALAAQMFACFVIYPRIIQNPRIIKNILLIITIASSIIAIDVFSGIGLTSRWTDRLLIENKFGTDPTALTRTAENNYMRQEIIASWQKFIFGNGLAAETSLIGPEAVLAGQLVGTASVATHSYGFGHNNYLSLLFIGGLAVGAPILIILLLNGCSSLLLSRALIQDNKTDATVLYACVWGSLIIVGLLTTSFLSGIFEERTTSLWYGIGTGMFYWASSETKNLKKSNIDKH